MASSSQRRRRRWPHWWTAQLTRCSCSVLDWPVHFGWFGSHRSLSIAVMRISFRNSPLNTAGVFGYNQWRIYYKYPRTEWLTGTRHLIWLMWNSIRWLIDWHEFSISIRLWDWIKWLIDWLTQHERINWLFKRSIDSLTRPSDFPTDWLIDSTVDECLRTILHSSLPSFCVVLLPARPIFALIFFYTGVDGHHGRFRTAEARAVLQTNLHSFLQSRLSLQLFQVSKLQRYYRGW